MANSRLAAAATRVYHAATPTTSFSASGTAENAALAAAAFEERSDGRSLANRMTALAASPLFQRAAAELREGLGLPRRTREQEELDDLVVRIFAGRLYRAGQLARSPQRE